MLKRHCFGVRWFTLLAVCPVVASVIGCGKEAGPKLVPVSGTITLDGEPLAGAGISFRPDAAKGNKFKGFIPSASADDEGGYELMTAARKGAPPGWYKVVVFPYSPPPGAEAPKVGPPPFNPKYSDPETTDLSIEVQEEAGPETTYDLELTK